MFRNTITLLSFAPLPRQENGSCAEARFLAHVVILTLPAAAEGIAQWSDDRPSRLRCHEVRHLHRIADGARLSAVGTSGCTGRASPVRDAPCQIVAIVPWILASSFGVPHCPLVKKRACPASPHWAVFYSFLLARTAAVVLSICPACFPEYPHCPCSSWPPSELVIFARLTRCPVVVGWHH